MVGRVAGAIQFVKRLPRSAGRLQHGAEEFAGRNMRRAGGRHQDPAGPQGANAASRQVRVGLKSPRSFRFTLRQRGRIQNNQIKFSALGLVQPGKRIPLEQGNLQGQLYTASG